MAKKTKECLDFFMASGFLLGGLGLGMMVSREVAGEHPLRWGVGIMLLGVLCYSYSRLTSKGV